MRQVGPQRTRALTRVCGLRVLKKDWTTTLKATLQRERILFWLTSGVKKSGRKVMKNALRKGEKGVENYLVEEKKNNRAEPHEKKTGGGVQAEFRGGKKKRRP